MATLNAEINLDLSKFVENLKQAGNLGKQSAAEIATNFQKTPIKLEGAEQIKNTVTQLSGSFTQLGSAGSKAASEIKNSFGSAIGNISKELDGVKPHAEGLFGTFKEVGKTALGVFGGGAMLGGVQGIVGGLEGLFEKGKKLLELDENIKIAFKTTGLEGDKLTAALKGASKQQSELGEKYAVSGSRIKEVQTQTALMGGVTGTSNAKITEASILIEKLTKNMGATAVSAETVVKAMTKGGPEGVDSIGRLATAYPALKAQLEGISDPGKKAQKTLEYLKDASDELANSDLVKAEKAELAFGKIKGTLGKNLVSMALPIMSVFGDVVFPIVNKLIDAFTFIINLAKEYYPITITLAAGMAAYAIATNTSAIATTYHTIATGVQTAAQWLLNLAMNANPIGLIIMGIAALIGIIATLWIKCEGFRNIVKTMWEAVQFGAKEAWAFIKLYFVTPFDAFMAVIKGAGAVLGKIFSGDFKGAISEIGNTVNNVGKSVQDNFNKFTKETQGNLQTLSSNIEGIYKKPIPEAMKKHNEEAEKAKVIVEGINKQYEGVVSTLESVSKKVTEGFDKDKQQATYIRWAKMMSGHAKEQAQLLAGMTEDQKKEYYKAQQASDDNLSKLEANAKTANNIQKVMKQAGEMTAENIGDGKTTKTKTDKTINKSDGVDNFLKQMSIERAKIEKDTNKIIDEDKIKSLEAEKNDVLNNEQIKGTKKLQIVAEIESKISAMKHQKDIDSLIDSWNISDAEINKKFDTEKAKKGITLAQIKELETERINLLNANDEKYNTERRQKENVYNLATKNAADKANNEIAKSKQAEQVKDIDNQIKLLDTHNKIEIDKYKELQAQKLLIEYSNTLGVKGDRSPEQAAKYKEYQDKMQALGYETTKMYNNLETDENKKKYLNDQLELKKSLDNKEISEIQYLVKLRDLNAQYAKDNDVLVSGLYSFIDSLRQDDANKAQAQRDKEKAQIDERYNQDKTKLAEQLASGKIKYQEYSKSMESVNKTRNDDEKKLNDERFKYTDNINKALVKSFESMNKMIGEQMTNTLKELSVKVKEGKTIWQDIGKDVGKVGQLMAGTFAATFGEMLAKGEKFGKAFEKSLLGTLLDTASKAILTFIPQIYAQFISWMGPFLGIPAATASIALIEGGIAVAKGAIGAEEGLFPGIKETGAIGKSDTTWTKFNPKTEAIFPAKLTAQNSQLFKHLWMGGTQDSYFNSYYSNQAQPSNQRVDVTSSVKLSFGELKAKGLDLATTVDRQRQLDEAKYG